MAKPSAVTEIETIPYSAAACVCVCVKRVCDWLLLCVMCECATVRVCVCGCTATFVRVLHAGKTEKREERKKCAIVAYHIIKKKRGKKMSDSANSVSVRIQITNKCPTLLNRPLAIIAGPTRHFQNL